MPLIGIIAKTRDVQAIKKELKENDSKIIKITKDTIRNVKNVGFEEIIILEDINLGEEEYRYIKSKIFTSQWRYRHNCPGRNKYRKTNKDNNIWF